MAAALYNRAGYQVRKLEYGLAGEIPRAEPQTKESLFEGAMADLRRSIALDRDNVVDTLDDPDFQRVRPTKEFHELIFGEMEGGDEP